MSVISDRTVIGMDPRKRSATIEVMAGDETIIGGGRFDTDRNGYTAMKTYASRWPNRVRLSGDAALVAAVRSNTANSVTVYVLAAAGVGAAARISRAVGESSRCRPPRSKAANAAGKYRRSSVRIRLVIVVLGAVAVRQVAAGIAGSKRGRAALRDADAHPA